MLIKQNSILTQLNSVKKIYLKLFLLLCVGFICHSQSAYSNEVVSNSIFCENPDTSEEITFIKSYQQPFTYYLNISDFANSFIEIPTSNVSGGSSTISSTYLAGRAVIYDANNNAVGTCSASFLCMQNAEGIYTDISNYLTVNTGLIVTWFTPTTLINLELDTIINSMVTECIVVCTTKVGVNPYYGQTFDLIVSSDNQKIYFQFTRTGNIF